MPTALYIEEYMLNAIINLAHAAESTTPPAIRAQSATRYHTASFSHAAPCAYAYAPLD